MTKKDYERIATAFQDCYPGGNVELLAQWIACRDAVARAFKADNYRFVEGRFFAACEPGANVRARHGY
jgi:hypothetical protein